VTNQVKGALATALEETRFFNTLDAEDLAVIGQVCPDQVTGHLFEAALGAALLVKTS